MRRRAFAAAHGIFLYIFHHKIVSESKSCRIDFKFVIIYNENRVFIHDCKFLLLTDKSAVFCVHKV